MKRQTKEFYGRFSILTVLRSMRVFGASPVRGAASIASTAAMPSTTRPNAV